MQRDMSHLESHGWTAKGFVGIKHPEDHESSLPSPQTGLTEARAGEMVKASERPI